MELLPTSLGTRPRLAVEIRPEGVVAARAEDAEALVSAVAYGVLEEGTLVPGLKAGNVAERAAAVAAVRRALEAVVLKDRRATLVVPDSAVRVLLLDFDALPAKAAEALPVVRFRLKKLLPFDVEDAVVSYQVMSSTRSLVRVLAVAVPKEVLAEYEGVVREAGFEPGAALPSTLAACAGLAEVEVATLLVNAGERSVTTAIVQGGILLLHRTVDLAAEGFEQREEQGSSGVAEPAVPRELQAAGLALPRVDVGDSAEEWARQEPVRGDGGALAEQDRVGVMAAAQARRLAEERAAAGSWASSGRMGEESVPREAMLPALPTGVELEERRLAAAAREVTQAVSVAAAYFEDTLQTAPGLVLAAGTIGAEVLGGLLREAGFSEDEMRVREMIEPAMLTGGAVTARVPAGWMAGVRGALRG